MRNKRKGFTLAEVLITLGIIGVVAAITLPTLMQDASKQQLGVKLAKFSSNLEKITRAAAVEEDLDNYDDIWNILSEELIFNKTPEKGKLNDLRDGTSIRIFKESKSGEAAISDSASSKMGDASGVYIEFHPNISGLDGETLFDFGISKKGYVVPLNSDTCLKELFKNKWKAAKYYKTGEGQACKKTSHGYADGGSAL